MVKSEGAGDQCCRFGVSGCIGCLLLLFGVFGFPIDEGFWCGFGGLFLVVDFVSFVFFWSRRIFGWWYFFCRGVIVEDLMGDLAMDVCWLCSS